MIDYKYDDFEKDVKILAQELNDYPFDAMVLISRGALTFGHFLASALKRREVYTINCISYDGTKKLNKIKVFNIPKLKKHKKILLIDDIIDSGDTIKKVHKKLLKKYPHLQIKIVSIFYKSASPIKPDFSVKSCDEWINFFWENL